MQHFKWYSSLPPAMRQVIIARKDLNMSPGKLAEQVSHASMAFLMNMIRQNKCDISPAEPNKIISYVQFDKNIWDGWINGIFTKTICEAKNLYQLEKVIPYAEELGLKENEDFFLIKDNCLTELEPEEIDENGVGRTLTCVGFRPLPDDIAHLISKKYQLYK